MSSTRIDDDELTRLAAQELERDGKMFMRQREAEFRATQMKRPFSTNKIFLNNVLKNVMSFNRGHRSHHNEAGPSHRHREARTSSKSPITHKINKKSHKRSKSKEKLMYHSTTADSENESSTPKKKKKLNRKFKKSKKKLKSSSKKKKNK